MEIVGIGTDIVERLRIARMIEQHGELFLARVYTDWEMRHCQARKHSTEHFAGLWAAKEAVFKALGAGFERGTSWTDIEVRTQPGGPPVVTIGGAVREHAQAQRVAKVLVTMAHCRAYATAYALALREPPRPEPPPPPVPPPAPSG